MVKITINGIMNTKTVRIRVISLGRDRVAEPRNELARRFCQLVGRPYLTEEEVFIIRKIGMVIEEEKESP